MPQIQVPIAELQKKSVFVATPMYGGQCFGSYTKSILDLSRLFTQYGINAQFSFLFNESLITRARNYMADEFMRSQHTHMMFIDSDIDFDPNDVIALLALDKPIIGGPYPKKCIAWENIFDAVKYGFVKNDERWKMADYSGDFVFNAVPGAQEMKLDQAGQVLEMGTGFMMIARPVFELMAEKYPQNWFTPDHNRSADFNGSRKIFQYFQAEIEPLHNRYLSEDYYFCQKAREAGSTVWFAPWMSLGHHGTYIYRGSIPAMATVINERIKRNDPVPTTVRMDGSHKVGEATVDPGVMSVKAFAESSSGRRTDLLTAWAAAGDTELKELRKAYNAVREEWLANLPDAPIADKISSLVIAMKKSNVAAVVGPVDPYDTPVVEDVPPTNDPLHEGDVTQ